MSEELKSKSYLTPNEVAQWMMVSPITVRGWAQKNMIQAEVTPGGHRRFRREEVERFARQWNASKSQGPLRVLIVDDDKFVVGYLKELLSSSSDAVSVEVAYDGFEAGRKMQTFLPDIVLLDCMMPGMQGAQVCKQIKLIPGLTDVRVIAMSGYLSAEKEEEMVAAGAECCLPKPLDVAKLLTVMGISA